MLSTAWSNLALLRPVVITLAPSTASLRAISRPMPLVEPVTMADLLFRCRSMMVPPSDAGPCMLAEASVVRKRPSRKPFPDHLPREFRGILSATRFRMR